MYSKEPQPLPLPSQKVIDSILEKVHQVCVFGSTNSPYNKNTCKLTKNSVAFFALKHRRNDSEGRKNKLFRQVAFASLAYGTHESEQESLGQQNRKWRREYLYGLMAAMELFNYHYGLGNCEAMAAIAFIESVLQDITCTISLVRFDNSSDSSIEEINAVALGNWPEPGCIILSPWQGDFGKSYVWEGLKNTKALSEEDCFNRSRCLFSISGYGDDHQDKAYIKKYLQSVHYENWLRNPERLDNLARIRNDFLNCINQATFFKGKNTPFDNYKSLTKWGATSKSNYAEVEKIKADLKEDEVVKSIFKMPRI